MIRINIPLSDSCIFSVMFPIYGIQSEKNATTEVHCEFCDKTYYAGSRRLSESGEGCTHQYSVFYLSSRKLRCSENCEKGSFEFLPTRFVLHMDKDDNEMLRKTQLKLKVLKFMPMQLTVTTSRGRAAGKLCRMIYDALPRRRTLNSPENDLKFTVCTSNDLSPCLFPPWPPCLCEAVWILLSPFVLGRKITVYKNLYMTVQKEWH